MVHSKVFECFQEHLPAFAEKVETYFPNGKNSIRVRQKDGKEFIFSEAFGIRKRCSGQLGNPSGSSSRLTIMLRFG